MQLPVLFFLLHFIALVYSGATNEPFKFGDQPAERKSRKNYYPYFISKTYSSNRGDTDDDDSDSTNEPDDNKPSPPSDVGNPPSYGYKGYPTYSQSYPQTNPNYKGYPYGGSYWKGSYDFVPGAVKGIQTPDMTDYIKALTAMQDSKPEENPSFLSKLKSNPKTLLLAGVVPLALVMAGVIPVLVNYAMTGMPLPVISTTASASRYTRDIKDMGTLKFENIVEIARALDSDDCMQKTLCRVATGDIKVPGSVYIKKTANALAKIIQDDWLTNEDVKELVHALKQENCTKVCNNRKATPRDKLKDLN